MVDRKFVEAAEAWAREAGEDLIALHHADRLYSSGYSDNVKRLVPLIVKARAALSAEKAEESDYKHEAYMQRRRADMLSETLTTMHWMIDDVASAAGVSHGVDEPVLNSGSVLRWILEHRKEPALSAAKPEEPFDDDSRSPAEYGEPAPTASAQGETPTLEECRRVGNSAANGWDGHSESAIDLACDAVRALCLSRAPSSSACMHRFSSNPGMYDTQHRYCEICGVAE